jgi:hypothetical protein
MEDETSCHISGQRIYGRLTASQAEQCIRLSKEVCPAGEWEPSELSGRALPGVLKNRHTLARVSTRRMRDLFRKKIWWRCYYCNLNEEQINV